MQTQIQAVLAARQSLGVVVDALANAWAADERLRNLPKRQALTTSLVGFVPNPVRFGAVIEQIAKACEVEVFTNAAEAAASTRAARAARGLSTLRFYAGHGRPAAAPTMSIDELLYLLPDLLADILSADAAAESEDYVPMNDSSYIEACSDGFEKFEATRA